MHVAKSNGVKLPEVMVSLSLIFSRVQYSYIQSGSILGRAMADENVEFKTFEDAIIAVRDLEISTNTQFICSRKTKNFNKTCKFVCLLID
jgi:hypothetical protein